MKSYTKKTAETRRDFLLTFFQNDAEYEEAEVNGFFLVKQINGSTGKPVVAIYRKKAYKRYKNYIAGKT